MNSEIITNFILLHSFKSVVLIVILAVAVLTASYNRLYLYHSLHVTGKHMGINASVFIKRFIELGVIIAMITVLAAAFFLVTGWY
ncbi:MAG TPA: hypothetical protein VLG67_03005 [Candidatus Saccharimonadales bacterium]|nr:hypothetical protein [Candidatus Saccharimonadales bacterium]